MAISKDMRKFLQTWWDQRDNPRNNNTANPKGIVRDNAGLCAAIGHYADLFPNRTELWIELSREFELMLEVENLNAHYPFDGDEDGIGYYLKSAQRKMHLNPARRAWVEAKLKA